MLDQEAVRLAPIRGADLAAVGAFLHEHLNPRLSASEWARSIVPTWPVSSPNHGFLLRAGEQIVGVQLAFYSEREIDGVVQDFCNLGAWCVLENHRSQGVRLLRAVLRQKQYHLTDLSPSGNVVRVNAALGFESLDTATVLRPHLPGLPRRGVRVVSDHRAIERLLDGEDLRIFRDHRHAAAAIHLALVDGDEHCYVVVRRDRRKGLPIFASLLHVGDPGVLRRHLTRLGQHLLTRHGLLCSLVEVRLLGWQPSMSIGLSSPRPKMFRPARATPLSVSVVDNLYSELVLVAW